MKENPEKNLSDQVVDDRSVPNAGEEAQPVTANLTEQAHPGHGDVNTAVDAPQDAVTSQEPDPHDHHGEAQPPSSQPPSTPDDVALQQDPPARERGAQRSELQHPDGESEKWRPHDDAYATARRIAPDVSLDLLVTKYWLYCHEKKTTPTSSHWMKWVIDEQKQIIDAERRERRQAAVNERRSRQWYAVAD